MIRAVVSGVSGSLSRVGGGRRTVFSDDKRLWWGKSFPGDVRREADLLCHKDY